MDLEQPECAAMADFFRAADPALASEQGVAVLEEGGVFALSVATLSGSRMFNHAVGVTVNADLDAIDAFYRLRGCTYTVSPAPGTELDQLLEQRRLTRDYAWMKFEREPAAVSAATELHVEPIGQEQAASFGRITSVAFAAPSWMADWVGALPGREGWSCYLSYDDDEPVGAGALHVSGEAAWLGFGATLPEHRGKGSQSAIFAARITEAREKGCRVIVTETGERTGTTPSTSYRNILKAGFSEAYIRPNWASPSQPPAG